MDTIILVSLGTSLPMVLIISVVFIPLLKLFKLRFNGWVAFMVTWVATASPSAVKGQLFYSDGNFALLFIPLISIIATAVLMHLGTITKTVANVVESETPLHSVGSLVELNAVKTPLEEAVPNNLKPSTRPIFGKEDYWKVGLIVLIVTVLAGTNLFLQYNKSKSNNFVYELIDNACSNINKDVPMLIDKYTTLLKATPQGRMVQYSVQVDIKHYCQDFNLSKEELSTVLELGAKSAYCRDPSMEVYRKNNVSFRYVYLNPEGEKFHDAIVDVTNCE